MPAYAGICRNFTKGFCAGLPKAFLTAKIMVMPMKITRQERTALKLVIIAILCLALALGWFWGIKTARGQSIPNPAQKKFATALKAYYMGAGTYEEALRLMD